MKLEEIGFYTLSDDRVKQVSDKSPLWRCELLLTDRCNFKCPYCRGVNVPNKKDLSVESACDTLEYWISQGLKNVRFSGGEPTLYPYLKELVAIAKSGGVEHIAISTNGSNNLKYYLELIDAGVNDFSISLDACCASFGKKMCGGIDGMWEKVVSNIKEIAKRTYVTVGIVITDENVSETKEVIQFAHDLGVADIRVISAAQYNKTLEQLNEIDDALLAAHPILKYRVTNFRANFPMRGISDTDVHHCALVLDDMAVKDGYHYPCIIYMREGGKPIGRIDSGNVRQERLDWFRSHATIMDNICKNNCLDVCVDYNNRYFRLQTEKELMGE